jgi:hypothetical protein
MDDCTVPGCVQVRVNTRSGPVDVIGVHVHPDGESVDGLVEAAINEIALDPRLAAEWWSS